MSAVLDKLKGKPSAAKLQQQVAALDEKLAGLRQRLAEAERTAVEASADETQYGPAAAAVARMKAELEQDQGRLERLRIVHLDALRLESDRSMDEARSRVDDARRRFNELRTTTKRSIEEECARHKAQVTSIDAELRASLADLHEAQATEEAVLAVSQAIESPSGLIAPALDKSDGGETFKKHERAVAIHKSWSQSLRAPRELKSCAMCGRVNQSEIHVHIVEMIGLPSVY